MKYFFTCQTAAKNIIDGTHNLVTVIEIMGRRNWPTGNDFENQPLLIQCSVG
jgi:hypothetical protein